MEKKRILVYPCGTEIALEIHKALHLAIHYEIWGGSCSYDHGRFVFENHIDNLPFLRDSSSPKEVAEFNEIIKSYGFDFIYPAMDGMVTLFSQNRECLDPVVIAPHHLTAEITRSKRKTYAIMSDLIAVPHVYTPDEIDKFTEDDFPVFIKPDVGQGSVGTHKINNFQDFMEYKEDNDDQLVLEYLPGKEYTIDCFTNAKGKLVYFRGRERKRIRDGISVNAAFVDRPEFEAFARAINRRLDQKGGWFFQLREAADGSLKLLEVASRIAGASAIQRCVGVNLPLLTVNMYNGIPVDDVVVNDYDIELDRALANCYRMNLYFDTVFTDYDDTMVLYDSEGNGSVNLEMIRFIYHCHNDGKRVVLLSKHDGDLEEALHHFKISEIFDDVIHMQRPDDKAEVINDFLNRGAEPIFIDDSYGERKNIADKCNIPVFDTAMIECLL